MGMDVSSLLSLENSGVTYYDFQGQETDLLKVLKDNGITHIRLRIWNDPYDQNGSGYGGGNCDLENAIAIGERAAKYGLKVIIDFHYSDFWADPGKQMAPKAWRDLSIEDKSAELYDYTYDCLTQLKKHKIEVAMVQLGNETNNGLAGETVWMNVIYQLMANGVRAVREVYPKALIAVHFANPENTGNYENLAYKLNYYDLDYDVFATSYYPYWRGSLENLQNILNTIADRYQKKTMIMECSYAYTDTDSDFSPNTVSAESAVIKNYPYTIQGQTNAITDIIKTAAEIDSCLGICYWEGAWISVGTSSLQENQQLWEKYGSGWASSYAAEYDPEDAGKYYGGSAVDNQAFFDPQGQPLESLKLFALVRKGNEIELKADAIEDTYVTLDINDPISLPSTVKAIMSDNSRQEIPVSWQSIDEDKLKAQENKTRLIKGEADGLQALCYLKLESFNYLKNPSFEEDENGSAVPSFWNVNMIKLADEMYVEDKALDSLSGSRHYHFWSKDPDSIEFELEQEASGLAEGNYSFSISIMGGDSGESEIYAYVRINDEIIAKEPMNISSYNNWDKGQIDNFAYDGNAKLTLGIYVKCHGTGNGAWGKIDDAALNRNGD